MKTTKEEILTTSLKLFARHGFTAVSTSMIAGELGITKGALYRHFTSKQEIFDSIIQRMFELDEQRASEDHVPAREYGEDQEGYENTKLSDFCEFAINQFTFWTEDEFACNFRRMITLEQFSSDKMNKLYQDVIAMGPVNYSADLLGEMLKNGQLNEDAEKFGAWNLAVQLFAPLQLMIQLADGGADPEMLKKELRTITKEFEHRWRR